MDPKRLKWLLWIGALGILFLAMVLATTAFMLPAYVESRLIPSVTKGWGLEPRQIRVRRIGLWGADLGPIQYASGEQPVFSIAAIQIDYSPLSLLRGQINGITLGGVQLTLEADEKGVTIPGLILPLDDTGAEESGSPQGPKGNMPIQLKRFVLRRSNVVLTWKERRYAIPVDVALDTSRMQDGLLQADAEVALLGNPLTITANLDLNNHSAQVKLAASGFRLESLALTGQLPAGIGLAGDAKLEAQARLQLTPLTWAASLKADIRDARINTPQATIVNAGADGMTRLPIVAKIEGDSDTGIRWSCAPLQIITPVLTRIDHLEGQWKPVEDGWRASARLASLTATQNLAPGINLSKGLTVQWEAQASQSGQNPLKFKVDASADQPLLLKNGLIQLTNTNPSIAIEGRFENGHLAADAAASLKRLRLKMGDNQVDIPKPSIKSRYVMRPSDNGTDAEITVDIDLSKMTSTLGSASIRFPRISVRTKGQSSPGRPWQFKTDISATNGQVVEGNSDLRLKGIYLALPLQWPPTDRGDAGRIDIKSIQLAERQFGDLKGTLRQKSIGLNLALKHRSKLFPGLTVLVNGGVKDTGIQIEAKLPDFQIPDGTELGQFMPPASGLMITGRVKGNCVLALFPGSIQSQAYLKFDEGSLIDSGREMVLEGIRAEIELEDLINIRSRPLQKLKVDRLRFGNLTAEALAVDFQLEPNRTVFIEKASLNWCKGHINTAAIRIVPDKDDYEVTLSCDRLNLAMLLEQLGAAEASGEGSVNGRIPLRWTDGRLSFDKGFLYSTPGQTGAIQLSGTQALLAGLPPGTPQHTQLDIATEALKDYTYKWAKLALTSDEEDLLLKLQFDGKPNRLLPFAYDKSLGQFKRIAGQGQADFKGISIDLNFTSPLNDIIHYKDFLKQN